MARLSSGVISRLQEICPSRVVTDPEKLVDYSHDESPEKPHPPDALVRPVNAGEIAAIIKLARQERIPVTPRGLGTGLAGGAVPIHGGIVISTELMNRIVEIDTANLMVVTQPGVITAQLQKACQEHHLYYPVDPASLEECSIGGNVATNAGGARAFKYGVTGDYVTGIQAVLADGTIINYGGKLRKNATGYDLSHILIGSEGTLGIITEITFRLVPYPRHQIDLLIPFNSLAQGVELVLKLAQEKRLIPAVIEFIEKKGIAACNQVLKEELPGADAAVHILVELEGNEREQVLDDAVAVACLAQKLGAGEPLIADNPASQARLWHTRRSLAKTLKQLYPQVIAEDIVVPLARIPDTVQFITELEKRFNVVIVPFGHIGDGNIHCDLCRTADCEKEKWAKTAAMVIDELIDFVVRAGGQVTAEHGIGSLKRHLLKKGLTENEIALMRKIKYALDPDNILNPGKIFPSEI